MNGYEPPSPAKGKLSAAERRARQADRLTTIRLRMAIWRALDDRGISGPASVARGRRGAAVGRRGPTGRDDAGRRLSRGLARRRRGRGPGTPPHFGITCDNVRLSQGSGGAIIAGKPCDRKGLRWAAVASAPQAGSHRSMWTQFDRSIREHRPDRIAR